MKTAVLSVVYPAAKPFFGAFLESWTGQKDKDFELLLVNDGMEDLESTLRKYSLKTRVKSGAGTAVKLRKTAITWALESGFEAIIFADADDTYENNRVSVAKRLLDQNPLIFNELVLFGEGRDRMTPMFGGRFREGQRIGAQELLDSNCLGLSNTAVLARTAEKAYQEVPDTARVYDWPFFAFILRSGCQAQFTQETRSYYRQHAGNFAAPQALADEEIKKGLDVKNEYYGLLGKYGEPYASRRNAFRALLEKFCTDSRFKESYCRAVREKAPQAPLWWEPIKTEREVMS